MCVTNQICFLQRKWELARASLSASGTGPTRWPRSSSMYRAPSIPFPWGTWCAWAGVCRLLRLAAKGGEGSLTLFSGPSGRSSEVTIPMTL